MITIEIPANDLDVVINKKIAYIHVNLSIEEMERILKLLKEDCVENVHLNKITMKVE